MEEKKFTISEGILNAILGSLAVQPYKNVVELIKAIEQGAKPVETDEAEVVQ